MELPPAHWGILERYLRVLDTPEADIRQTTDSMEREARRGPRARLLLTVPSIGPLTALLFLAEVGDIQRFPEARRLVSYAGLAPVVRASGGKTRLGPISKQGSRWLRWVFSEAAARIGRRPGPLGEFYRWVRQRHGSQTANTALARKLLVIAYPVLKSGRPDEERG